ncbi:MAG: hypothetical protein AAGH64_08025 [Planctomycetota bacterium]
MPDDPNKQALTPATLTLSLVAWCALGSTWYALTTRFHPDRATAALVTAALIGSYALASYANHLFLVPRLRGRGIGYWVACAAVACVSGAVGLLGARTVYILRGHTPGSPLYNLAIDTFGAIVHLAIAAGVVWLWKRAHPQRVRP